MPQDHLVAVLPRLESELGSLTGEPVALGGGLTNHNVRMCLGGADVVVRFCAEGVDMLGIDRSVEDLAGRSTPTRDDVSAALSLRNQGPVAA